MDGPLRLDPDFAEFCASLTARQVRFLIVGGYAVAAHGRPRMTGDLDLWIMVERANAERLVAALEDFGFASLGLDPEDFEQPNRVVQIGYAPLRIDLLTSIDGVEFASCWERRIEVPLDNGLVPVISLDDLLANKRAAGRAQDLADVEGLRDRNQQ